MCGNYIGRKNLTVRAKVEARSGRKCLLDLGYVSERILDVDGKKERCFEISPSGCEALAAAEKAPIETPTTSVPNRLGKPFTAILAALDKSGPLSRAQIKEATGIKSGT